MGKSLRRFSDAIEYAAALWPRRSRHVVHRTFEEFHPLGPASAAARVARGLGQSTQRPALAPRNLNLSDQETALEHLACERIELGGRYAGSPRRFRDQLGQGSIGSAQLEHRARNGMNACTRAHVVVVRVTRRRRAPEGPMAVPLAERRIGARDHERSKLRVDGETRGDLARLADGEQHIVGYDRVLAATNGRGTKTAERRRAPRAVGAGLARGSRHVGRELERRVTLAMPPAIVGETIEPFGLFGQRSAHESHGLRHDGLAARGQQPLRRSAERLRVPGAIACRGGLERLQAARELDERAASAASCAAMLPAAVAIEARRRLCTSRRA